MVLMPYSDRWRALRKVMHGILNGQQQETKFYPYQELESKQLLYEYLHSPEKWYKANLRYSNSVVMSVVFGRRARMEDPELQELFETAEVMTSNLTAGANIVDMFTWVARLPKFLQWWRPYGEKWFHETRRYEQIPKPESTSKLTIATSVYKRELDRIREKMGNGNAPPCFAVDFEQTSYKTPFDETQKCFALGALMEAGSDTSRTSTNQLLAAAALYPDFVKTARAELDEICGYNAERLPVFSDKEKLPYIMAVVKEVLRWRPFVSTGIPHMLTKDDEYEGYKFPAGTVFTWNAYGIALSAVDYDRPIEFLPERFLNDDLHNATKGHWAFGAGTS